MGVSTLKAQINKREKQLLIFLGVALGVFIVITYVVDPFLETQANVHQDLADKLSLLQKSRAKVAQIDRLESEITGYKKYLELANKRMLPGKKPALAAAELQKLLKKIARSSDVNIRQEKILNSVDLGEYKQIPVQVTFVSNATALKTILYHIENNTRLLLVPVMKIKVTSTRNPREIETTLVVAGLIRS